jgi:hypothetical protein
MTTAKALNLPEVEPGVDGRLSAVPEPDDIVLRILKTIQQDLADFRRSTEERFAQVFEKLREHDEKFAALHSIMTFHMGVTFQHQYQLEHIDAEIKALKSAASPP